MAFDRSGTDFPGANAGLCGGVDQQVGCKPSLGSIAGGLRRVRIGGWEKANVAQATRTSPRRRKSARDRWLMCRFLCGIGGDPQCSVSWFSIKTPCSLFAVCPRRVAKRLESPRKDATDKPNLNAAFQ
jgi:hypothetical protein